jgi:hypothetical protein
MMIQGHTIDALIQPDSFSLTVFPWNLWDFLRGLTAPVFLTVSGAVQVFANKRLDDGSLPQSKIARRFRTALILIGIGYLLVFPAEKIYDLPFIEVKYWQVFFQVNILQVFGISLLMVLGLFLLTKNDNQLGVSALVCGFSIFFLSPLIHAIHWFNFLPEAAAAYISLEHGSIFTVFPFSGYLFLGIAIGVLLKKINPDERIKFLIRWSPLAGVSLIIIGMGFSGIFSLIPVVYTDTQKADPGLALIRLGLVLLWITVTSLMLLFSRKLEPYYKMFGKKALFIYVAHLILLFGTPLTPGIATFYYKSLTLSEVIIPTIFVELTTLTVAFFYEYSVTRFPMARYFYRYSVAAYLIYVLFL